MGYTHYWYMTDTEGPENLWPEALQRAILIVQNSPITLGDWTGDEGTKPILSDGISLNGIEDDGHETFAIPANTRDAEDFAFCKTAHKPYDIVVTAILASLAHDAPASIRISSDGDPDDWAEGVRLAQEILQDPSIQVPTLNED